MPEILIKDENGNVIDVVCDHEYDDSGYCVCCGQVKYGSWAYYELYGGDPEYD